ncbi:MAG: hypothetical protein VYE22_04820 [Myxococcota bacterium]|nr:hypothetical protein [Myxococcota bacterium]
MGQVKGSAVTSRVRYIREHADEVVFREVKDRMRPAHRALLDAGVLPHAWVPFELFVDLNVSADAVLGRGDLGLCRDMGRFGATVTLPTLYRIFLRLGSVPFILRKASRLWNVHYDSGALDVDMGDHEATLTIRGLDTPHRAHCLSVTGWAEGAGDLTGARVYRAEETRCRTRGDAACQIEIAWKDRGGT